MGVAKFVDHMIEILWSNDASRSNIHRYTIRKVRIGTSAERVLNHWPPDYASVALPTELPALFLSLQILHVYLQSIGIWLIRILSRYNYLFPSIMHTSWYISNCKCGRVSMYIHGFPPRCVCNVYWRTAFTCLIYLGGTESSARDIMK